MKLGIRMHDTLLMPMEERFAHIHKLGFSCGHLALGKFCTDMNIGTEALTPGFAMYLRKLFAKNELDCAVLGCYLNPANPVKEQLEDIFDTYKAHIRFASYLGCGVVGTETGAPNAEYTYTEECRSEKALQTLIDNLSVMVGYAEKMGAIIGIEPVYSHIVSDPQRARAVLDRINSPNLQIILDPVNLLGEDNAERADEVIEEAIRLLGKDVAVVHIKDYRIENGKVVSVGAGLGQMDYTSLMQFVKYRKPYIHVTLENTTPENCLFCKDYIENIYHSV